MNGGTSGRLADADSESEILQVWKLDLKPSPAAVCARWAANLSLAEAERAGRFIREEDRARFVCGRGALRTLLGTRLGLSPRAVPLQAGASGKPELPAEIAPRIRFSISHSGEVVLVALSADADVGVDVELLRPLPDALALATRFFSPSESATLEALPHQDQLKAFYRFWTRKEAVLKASGQGISHGLAHVEVSGDAIPAMRCMDGDPNAGDQWTLCELEPAPDHLGAVAVHRPGAELAFREFDANIRA
jgi:4'-phosphopantetheinyl transferase